MVFPDGFSFTFDKKITTPKLSIPFNDYRDNFDEKSNLVDQISKNWNTQYLLLLKYKDHLQNAQYINKNQQDQDLYDTGIVDY